jgi:hypothetical protein
VYDFERPVEVLTEVLARFRAPQAGATGLHQALILERERTGCIHVSLVSRIFQAHVPHGLFRVIYEKDWVAQVPDKDGEGEIVNPSIWC